MSEKEKMGTQKDKMLEFFKDEAVGLINTKLTPEDQLQVSSIIPVDPRPILVKTPEVDQEENQKFWLDLRKFYQTSAGGMTPLDIEKQVVKPFYEAEELVSDDTGAYPFWIDPDVSGQGLALSKIIETAISNSSEKIQAGILANRLTGLLEAVTQLLGSDDELNDFGVLLDKSVQSYAKQIGLTDTDLEGYLSDWRQLKNALPKSGFLVTKSQVDLFELLSTALQLDIQASQTNFIEEIDEVIAHITDMLAIQNENTGEANAPDKLKSSFGESEDMLDFDKLSSMLPKGASELMSQVRMERLQSILEVLSGAAEFLNSSNQIIWQELLLGWKDGNFKQIFGDANTGSYPVEELVARAKHEFERLMVSYKDIIASFRIGKLELANAYNEEIHDDFFAHFNWHQITADELRSFPSIIVMLDANQFDKHLMAEFSEILGNNLPIHIVCIRAINDHMRHDEHYQEQFFDNFELASLAISYRQAFVMQASDADPELLYKGFSDGLSSPSASLFYVLFGEQNNLSWPNIAVRSRAFPNFTFSGKYGTDWGSRFNVSHNPQVAKNWPEYTFDIVDEEKQITDLTSYLTYADYKLLNKSFSSEFKVVPRAYWTDDLVHLASYLSMEEKDQYAKIPYIWGLSAENELQKVAVSWEMMIKTAEKMDYWQFIQENGGVNSYHVREALSREKRRLQEEAAKEIDKLKAAQGQELEKVREETAAESMDRLTALLLDIDTQSIITTPASKPVNTIESEDVPDQVEVEEEVATVEADEVLSMDEAWIETPLCTSCNECIELNGSLFKYNADKMAVLGDVQAGTFAQLVQAAEKCPVRIIHPGKPVDSSEPDLEDLIKRAEKFN